jgi:hypothetical protein
MPVAIGLVDLGVLLALIVLVGLSYSYRYTLGALLQALVAALDAIRLPHAFGIGGQRIFGVVADGLDKLDHTIRHYLGRGVEDMQAAWNASVSYTATAVNWIGKEIASLSHDTAQAVEGLATVQVPRWVKNRLAAGLAAIAVLKAEVLTLGHSTVKVVERTTHVVTHRVKVIERTVIKPTTAAVPKVITRVEYIGHAIAQPDIGAIPRTIPGIKALERDFGAVKDRLKGVARTLTPAGIVGLVGAAVFSLFGLSWLRCSNVGKVGKRVCGLNSHILEGLLAGLIAVFGTIGIVKFAEDVQKVVDGFSGEVAGFWRADAPGPGGDRALGQTGHHG